MAESRKPGRPRVLLLFNPGAGDGENPEADLKALLRAGGYEPTAVSVKDKNWEAALKRPTDLVVAAGGDGTVTKVAAKLRGKTAVFAVLPLGSANNIASGLGVRGTPRQVIAKWKKSAPRRFDFWRCTGEWGKELIIEGCGLGAITDAGAELSRADADGFSRKDKLAMARKFIRGLMRKAEPFQLKAWADGKRIKGEFLLFEICNLGGAGPRLRLVRDADPFDGLLDVVFVRPESRKAFVDWLDGGARKSWAARPSLRCRKLKLEWKGARLRLGDNKFWPEDDGTRGKKGKKGRKLSAQFTHERRTVTVLVPR